MNDNNLKMGVSFISQGDIFAIENVKSFAHGCNCAGAMGKGIALQFKQKFPEMYQQYRHLCLAGKFKPGDIFDYKYSEGHIYNLGTQETWRTNAKIEYITEALNKMLIAAEKDHVSAIAMPAIGAGLGGLDWKDVRAAINDCARYHPTVFLYVVESYKKGTVCIP